MYFTLLFFFLFLPPTLARDLSHVFIPSSVDMCVCVCICVYMCVCAEGKGRGGGEGRGGSAKRGK